MAAEEVAAGFLESLGYRLLERNFACSFGEIDIIATHDGMVVFIEVRSRGSASRVNPAYSVTRKKQWKIGRVAQYYLSTRFGKTPPARFDVVLVKMSNPPELELISDAFRISPS